MALTLQSWISRTLSRPRTRLRLELPLSITWRGTHPMARSTRCASTGSTRCREFPTWTHCWDPALLRTLWCCQRLRRPAILDRLLTAAGKDTRLIGLIESAHGLAAVEAIATATPRLTGLMLGAPMRQRAENRSSPQPRRPRTARFRASCRGFKGRSRLRASTRTYIVTEFGSANLKGLSSTERAN